MTTIAQYLRVNAQRHPGRDALVFSDTRITYREVDRRVDRIASALSRLGLKKGDRVAVLATNSHRFVELHFVLARVGLVMVPINVLQTPNDVVYVVDDAKPRAFIFDPSYEDVWEQVRQRTSCVDVAIRMGEKGTWTLAYDDLLDGGDEERLYVDVFGTDPRAVLYTSGTTAAPKGCLCTHGQLIASLSNLLIEIPIPRNEPSLLIAPAFTGIGAYMCGAMGYLGITNVIMPRFDPGAVLEIVAKEKIAHLFGVPTTLMALAREQESAPRDLSSLQLVGYGGATISPTQIDTAMSALGCDLYQFFGATETGGAITFLGLEDHRAPHDEVKRKRLWSCGRTALFAELRVVDDDGNELAPGQEGEFVVRSPASITEYLNRPEETAELFKGGWLHTGEIIRMDADGYVYIVDRKKDMIRSGGMSVAPSEVEAVLHEHPAILQAAVIGVPDPYYTEAVTAVVKLRSGSTVTESELISFVRQRLAGYKTPKSVEFVDALPVNSTGKILKRALREKYWQSQRGET